MPRAPRRNRIAPDLIGPLLRAAIKRSGKSGREVARLSEVNHSYMQKVLIGQRQPTIEWLEKVLGACDLTLPGLYQESLSPDFERKLPSRKSIVT